MDAVKIVKDSYHVMAKDLLEFRRNKMQLAALVMMPLIFLVMFGFISPAAALQQHMPMGIVNLDQGQASQEFIAQLDFNESNTSFISFPIFQCG